MKEDENNSKRNKRKNKDCFDSYRMRDIVRVTANSYNNEWPCRSFRIQWCLHGLSVWSLSDNDANKRQKGYNYLNGAYVGIPDSAVKGFFILR